MSIYIKNWDRSQRHYIVGIGGGKTEKRVYNRAPITIDLKVECESAKDVDDLRLALDLLAKDGARAMDIIEKMAKMDNKSLDELAAVKNRHKVDNGEDIVADDLNAVWIEL